MTRKIFAILLILALVFSLVACSSAEDEESAVSEQIGSGENTDDTNDDYNDDDTDNSTDSGSDNSYDSGDDTNSSDDGEDDDSAPLPPLSTDGKYTVTFDFGYENKSESEKTDNTVTEIKLSRNGYTFEGWFNGSDKWDFSQSVTGNMTLTAKWTLITYKITYQANGATLPSSNPTSYTTDKEHALEPATMKGKSFLGWSIDNGKEKFTLVSIPKGMYGDLVLTPVWDDTVIIFGKYEQDDNPDNGKEDIEWVKLKEENGKILLISKKILDAKQYAASGKNGSNMKWSNCTLRSFLNDGFYKTVFTADEKAAIIQTQINTPGSHDGSTSKDYVFLLSTEEAGQYMASYASRRANVTPYAEKNGVQNSSLGGWWWLRTKCSSYNAALVENDGNIRSVGYGADMTTIGMRPCIWVDASKI